jgi:hypothetical protein
MKGTLQTHWRVLSAVGVLALAVATSHGNLLLNPSLESGSSTTQADYWTLHPGDTFRESIPVFGFTGPAMKDGLYAVKMFGGEGDLSQTNILVQPNFLYDVSGWFYHSSTEDMIANDPLSTRMFMHVEWFDSGGGSLGNDFTANHNGTSPADEWVPIIAQFLSPAGAHHATFHVESDSNVGGGSVFGDQFSFVPEPTVAMLVLGGGWLLLRRRRAE